ncbi:hypothetical protein CANARDRAFT_193248 [[Candida] arabinofermentans NRRL YB-2248]|uniref:Carbonic anhydrase n=1 Tax=[Candida] arabinofermentans NRRL YB-2248 TaxID=983967 RepID=A0A1E4T7D0_9ASCO|nr:hypothetical protein CANARDRAFT_193248 [[Candida] arabinofermentans NRRL YB-2248]
MGINNIIRFEHANDPTIENKHHHHKHKQIEDEENLLQKDLLNNNNSSTSSLSSQSTYESSDSYPFQFSRDSSLQDFLKSNKQATDNLKIRNPEILERSGKGQSPHTLWIGCSDSRINECTALGCQPGEIFTLRNIANLISYQDFSSMSALKFAIDVLKVRKIIVCGHTDCGGVWASLSSKKIGDVLDSWLTPIRQIRAQNLNLLKSINDPFERCSKLSELNVLNSINQVKKHSSFVSAFKNGDIEIYGLIYDVKTGYLTELELSDEFDNNDDFNDVFHLNEHGDGYH